jgi:hypothetical protein
MNWLKLKNFLRKIQKDSKGVSPTDSSERQKQYEVHFNYGLGSITLRESDIFLTSYPKSGNTWMRFLIANLIASEQDVSFLNIESIVPDIYKNTEEELIKLPVPRIIKSHEKFDPRYKKVIYVVRNPGSVAISFYHHLIKFQKISPETTFKSFVNGFVKGEYIPRIGNWNENVTSWLNHKSGDRENFLLIKYEDLKFNTFEEMKKVALFLKIDLKEDENIEKAMQLSSFENMQKLETIQYNAGFLKDTDPRRRFVRSSDTNEWKKYLDEECIDLIQSKFGEAIQKLGYSLANSQS